MKFTQLFNWLRFKLVTPFQAMRNRFFIERDSKHRRIMVNFGFTFRNSKWASFAQTNLSSKIPSFFKINNVVLQLTLLLVLVFLVSVILVKLNVTCSVFGGELFYSFVELVRTSLCYNLTIVLTTTSAFISALYSYILKKVFMVKTRAVATELATSTDSTTQLDTSTIFALQLKNLNTGGVSSAVEDLFQVKSKESSSLPVNLLYTVTDRTVVTNPTELNVRSGFVQQRDFSSKTFVTNNWTLLGLQAEQTHVSLENSNLLHNLSDVTFNSINASITSSPECQTISNLHMKYLQNLKIDRWLYRYSLLHRQSLHRAHDLTLTKKLTSLGFFSGNLTTNNLWAANFVNLTPDLKTTLTGLYKQTYGNIFNQTEAVSTPLTNVEFFESSYFWVLKRFYNLNTLDRNCVVSTVNPVLYDVKTPHSSDLKFYNTIDLPARANLSDLAAFSSLQLNTNTKHFSNVFNDDVISDVSAASTNQALLSGEVVNVAKALVNDKLTPNSSHLFFNHNNYNVASVKPLTWCVSDRTSQLYPTLGLTKTTPSN